MEGKDWGNTESFGVFKGPDDLVDIVLRSVVISGMLKNLGTGGVKILE